MAAVGRKESQASIASSEFEELKFDDDDVGPAAAAAPSAGSQEPASPTFAARYLPAGSGLVSSIFGKTRSVPAPEASQARPAPGPAPRPAAPEAPSTSAPATQALPSERAEPAGSAAQPQEANPFNDFEAATHKLGEAARDAASQILGGAVDAKTGLARLAGDVSTWWATLDPGAPAAGPNAQQSRQAEECHKLYGLDSSEELMEEFAASLAQTYACAHNNLTPSREVLFAGTLHITARHLCFSAPGDHITATVPLTQVAKAAVAGKHLAVTMTDGASLALTGFQPGKLNQALGLLEHLSQPQ